MLTLVQCSKLCVCIVILREAIKKTMQSDILETLLTNKSRCSYKKKFMQPRRRKERETGNKRKKIIDRLSPITLIVALNVNYLNTPIKGQIGRMDKKTSKIMLFMK